MRLLTKPLVFYYETFCECCQGLSITRTLCLHYHELRHHRSHHQRVNQEGTLGKQEGS